MLETLLIAEQSKETGKHVGAIIIGPNKEIRSTGFNGFPRGIDDTIDSRHSRETGAKYLWSAHAEQNAICNAALIGVSLHDCTIFVSTFPCVGCTKSIIQTGIKSIVTTEPDFQDPVWGNEFRTSLEMLQEVKINITLLAPEWVNNARDKIKNLKHELGSALYVTKPNNGN